jgi:hypothetical protein
MVRPKEEQGMTERYYTVMSPYHPRWDEFCTRLQGPEGCNFREDEDGKTVWDCGTRETDFALARPILERMGMNVERSLGYFMGMGGMCDCCILFNCDPAHRRDDAA